MGFEAKVVKHSISPAGVELVTGELTYPFLVHQDIWTHRTLWKTSSEQFESWLDASRSSSSNRAIPSERLIANVRADPFVPLAFRRRAKTMQGGEILGTEEQMRARVQWIAAARAAAQVAEDLTRAGVHKQWANRPMGPFQWITTVATANRIWWDHFLALRAHEAAQDEVQEVAHLFQAKLLKSIPDVLTMGDWHLPYVDDGDIIALSEIDYVEHGDAHWTVKRLSAARCARTSYLRQNETHTVRSDLELFDGLDKSVPPHAAPKEHVATPTADAETRSGNLVGWTQFRHAA